MILYRRGFLTPLIRCVTIDEARRIMKEAHESKGGDHTEGQTLTKYVLRYRYFWPTINRDVVDYARQCDHCQRFDKSKRTPSIELTQMVSPCPFAIRGINLIGVLPIAKGEAKYAIITVDYFTKWAEAEKLATITTKKVINFVAKSIIYRFSVAIKNPHR